MEHHARLSTVPGLVGVLALLLPLVPGCSQEARGADEAGLAGRLTLTGSSTCGPLVSEIARRFEGLHSGLRIDVQTGGSSRGIADVSTGLADIGMSSRSLSPAESPGRVSHVLARDGVCFLVNASNPVTELSDLELRGIYTGAIESWSEVGGLDLPITVIDRAQGRSELELVTSYLGIQAADIRPDLVAGENQQGIKMVAGDPSAICYMSVGTSELEAERGTPIRLLPLRGVPASAATVASGAFPLARPLLLITTEDPDERIVAFLDFARSKAVWDLVKEYSFVPVVP